MTRDWAFGWAGMLIGAVVAMLLGSSADAAEVSIPAAGTLKHHAYVITSDALPARVVTRDQAAMVEPNAVLAVVTHQTHVVDLDRDYIRQGAFKIDENHWLPKAQRLARSVTGGKAQVIWGSSSAATMAAKPLPLPRLIIEKPGHQNTPKKQDPKFPGQWVRAE